MSKVWVADRSVGNILGQKLPAEQFTATIKLAFKPRHDNERFGLAVFGSNYSLIALQKGKDGVYITYNECLDAGKGKDEIEKTNIKLAGEDIYLQIKVNGQATATFNFSEDGKIFKRLEALL